MSEDISETTSALAASFQDHKRQFYKCMLSSTLISGNVERTLTTFAMVFHPTLRAICLIAFLTARSLTSPLNTHQNDPERRDNKWNLTCSNAPTVVAGTFLHPSDVPMTQPAVLPPSGSDQPWFSYLWCTPGTSTYTFFSNGRLVPPPLTYRNIQAALNDAITDILGTIDKKGDGPVLASEVDAKLGIFGVWYTSPAATNFMIQAQGSKEVLTYSVLAAALTGLKQYVDAGYDKSRDPIVFQINDGDRGEVGIGFVGYVDPKTKECMYQLRGGTPSPCTDVAEGKVLA